jgi:hypothetical protein
VRGLIVSVIALGALLLGAEPSLAAKKLQIGTHTAEELRNVCYQTGGAFSQDSTGYRCQTNCRGGPGTQCVIACKNDNTCSAQMPGRSRPAVSPPKTTR